MNPSIETSRRERIDAVLALAAPRLQSADGATLQAFARAYFHHLDADDLAARTPEDLLGALLSAWEFGAERQTGSTRLRVISPSLAEHGWASRHTVIEVVNDDMPFLVDSITMEINRQGLSLHLIVHPVLVVQRDAQGRLQALARAALRRSPRAGRARIVDARRGRPTGRPAASCRAGGRAGARAGRRAQRGAATGGRCSTGCTKSSPSCSRRRPRCRRRWPPRRGPSCSGWPTTTSR